MSNRPSFGPFAPSDALDLDSDDDGDIDDDKVYIPPFITGSNSGQIGIFTGIPPGATPTTYISDTGPFQADPESDRDHEGITVSSGVIVAIVVSVLVFFGLVMGIFAYLNHRKRKAAQEEVAMKETSSATAVTASGALDPPPPYELPSSRQRSEQRYDGLSDASDVTDEMGSHATITDGVAPGRGNRSS